MNKFRIFVGDIYIGTYDGENSSDAIVSYILDAGYNKIEDALNVLNTTEDEFMSKIDVKEE